MKKTMFFLSLIGTSFGVFAQNNFPPSGNVTVSSGNIIQSGNYSIDTQGSLKTKNYLLFDSDGDFTGSNYYTIQDDPSGNYLRMGYNFSNGLVLTSSGDVGLGNRTDPKAKLDIYQGSESWATIIKNGHGSGKGLKIQSAAANNTPVLSVQDNYDNTRFQVNSNGNIGIGTDNPQRKLEIVGGDSWQIKLSNDNEQKRLYMGWYQSRNAMEISTWDNGTWEGVPLSINPKKVFFNGNIGIGTQATDYYDLATSGNISVGADGNASLYARHINGKSSDSFDAERLYLNYGTGHDVWVGNETVEGSDLFVANGKIGIGTTTPSRSLTIYSEESNTVLGNNTKSAIRINNSFATSFGRRSELQFGLSDNPNENLAVIAAEYSSWDGATGGDLVFGTSPNNSTSMVERMRINHQGRIEAGPDATKGGLVFAQKYQNGNHLGTLSSNFSSGAFIIGYGAAGMPNEGTNGQLISTFDNFSGYRSALRVGPGTLEFLNTPKVQTAKGSQLQVTSRFLINKEGNVGIGTTTTGSHKLAVDGSIGAREIKVEVGTWSDFVFEKDYVLPTLKEVENHIATKGHLKDIPSAVEVEKNGIFLGEMDAKLLQKIEELTLYTIQQEKKISVQEATILQQQKELDELKSLAKRLAKIEALLENKE
ncbi:hypothetical protein [Aquimarina rhabdastrellae]